METVLLSREEVGRTAKELYESKNPLRGGDRREHRQNGHH